MFTGLIEGTGKVQGFRGGFDSGARVEIGEVPWTDRIPAGDSIAVNGVCLTAVADSDNRSFEAELSPETLSRSNLSALTEGSQVNLERPLRLGDRLGGHWVQGHVDGIGKITRIERTGDFRKLGVEVPKDLSRYVIEKGSIAIDGISLTVALLDGAVIEVAIIPKTWETTNLSGRSPGDPVNIEVDVLGKFVERLLFPETASTAITEGFLKKHGFL